VQKLHAKSIYQQKINGKIEFLYTKNKGFHASFEFIKKVAKTSSDKIFQRKIDKKIDFLCKNAKNFLFDSNQVKKLQKLHAKGVRKIGVFGLYYCGQNFSTYNFCWVR
jgi:hypothetical protein